MAEERARDSYLFTVRFWPERRVDGQVGWHAKVLGVTSGDSLYFRDFQTLVTFLNNQLEGQALVEEARGRAGSIQ